MSSADQSPANHSFHPMAKLSDWEAFVLVEIDHAHIVFR
jgi:hypothetical protein